MLSYFELDSPIGPLRLVGDHAALHRIDFLAAPRPRPPEADWRLDDTVFGPALSQLRDWFEGRRNEFDLPLAPQGTPFQLRVWSALRTIPYGQTWSYRQLAEAIGKPTATRAVGAANGRNPLPIIIPCHRVIGADGSLTGFGGGLPIKRWLLAREAGA